MEKNPASPHKINSLNSISSILRQRVIYGPAQKSFRFARHLFMIILVLAAMFQPQTVVFAAPGLTVTPLTWNVIGLDSNDVNAGPNIFPVGVRICNTDTVNPATNVVSTFSWDSANANINSRPGSRTTITSPSIAPSTCADHYYEVQITRTSAAYDTTRRFHVNVVSDQITTAVSSPQPRELYVEHLVSQSRNATTDVKLNGMSIVAGGTMTMVVGSTYNITLDADTATNGYEQVESYINFPNIYFQINSVASSYVANGGTDPLAPIRFYADGCGWVNDPTSPNYRSCTGTGKYGGHITINYNVTILGGAGTTQTLNSLIYDFSGSSYHYNNDFSTSARFVTIINPANLNISKAFVPASTAPGGTSSLTFTLTNPNPAPVSGVSFSDNLPSLSGGQMVVATPATYSTSGCGTPSFAPAAGASSLSFTNGTVAANSTCTVSVRVSVPATPTTGTYVNTSDPLFVNGINTGKTANSSLAVAAAPPSPGACGITLAQWTMPPSAGTGVPPASSYQAPDVASTTAQIGAGLNNSAISTIIGNPVNSWNARGFPTSSSFNIGANSYFQFAVTTTGYTSIGFSFDYRLDPTPKGPASLLLYSSTDGSTFTQFGGQFSPTNVFKTSFASPGTSNASGLTYFRVYGYNAQNSGTDGALYLDNVKITGCKTPQAPSLTKAFSPNPILVGGNSTLTFTLSNPNNFSLTGAAFNDALPAGLKVATPPTAASTCGGTWAPLANATSLALSGGTIPASGTCTVSVNVTASASGPQTNVSGFISTTESGTNTTATGSATATLNVVQPPAINKVFTPDIILANGVSTLTFHLTNPNTNDSLSGVAFADTLPTSPAAMVVAAAPAASINGCGTPNFAPAARAGSITFSNGTIAAGSTCTVSVNVTASSVGSYTNTSGAVSATMNGFTVNGNTASSILTVTPPQPSISLAKGISTSASGPWAKFINVPLGTSLYYQFIIDNTGNVPLSPVSVSDPTVSTASCSWPAVLPVAAPGVDPTATCVVGPISALPGNNTNTATAHGTYAGVAYPSLPSSASYFGANSALGLTKSASPTTYSAVGDVITYTYVVTNSGNVSLAGPFTVSDDHIGTPLGSAFSCGAGPLAPLGTVSCTASYTITQADLDAGSILNTATASGNGVTSSPASATVNATQNPHLSLAKTATEANFNTAGVTLHYTLVATNDGNVTLTGVSITDAKLGALTCSPTTQPATLAPAGILTCTGTYVTTQADVDAGKVDNTANAGGNFGATPVNALPASASVPAAQGPHLSLAKTATEANFNAAGVTLHYTLVAINDGNVSLTGVSITDAKLGTLTCTPTQPATMAPGGTLSCTGTYVTTQADVDAGLVANTATASDGTTTSLQVTATVPANQSLAILLTKTATETSFSAAGVTLHYTLVATNNGNVTLTSVSITDAKLSTLACTPGQPTTLAPGASLTCTGTYVTTLTDLTAGSVTNTATAGGNFGTTPINSLPATATVPAAAPVPLPPMIGIAKQVVGSPVKVSAGVFDVTFEFRVRNYGSQALSNVQVTDDLVTMFTGNATFTIQSLTSSGFTVNTAFNGGSDQNMLGPNNSLPVGTGYKTILLVLRVTPISAGPFNNTAIASGLDQNGGQVTDTSQNGIDPDNTPGGPPANNGDGNPTNNNEPTPLVLPTSLFDPPLGIKSVDDSGQPVLRWTMVWINESNIPALKARVSDPIPAGTTYAGGLVCTPASSLTTTSICAFEPPSVTYPLGRVLWEGTLGPDQGATSAATANNELAIIFNVTVQAGISTVGNTATIDADMNQNGIFDPAEIRVASASASWSASAAKAKAKKLPATGFAPGMLTNLPAQPSASAYNSFADLSIELPSLGVKTSIMGVPFANGAWDTTWLGNSAGYLAGTAFPGWQGNSVITGHVYAYNGLPGPFVNLGKLAWGQQIIIRAFGQKFIYEVRSVKTVSPVDVSVLGHKDNPWVTLITCKEFDPLTSTYKMRTVVQAVLIKAVADTGN